MTSCTLLLQLFGRSRTAMSQSMSINELFSRKANIFLYQNTINALLNKVPFSSSSQSPFATASSFVFPLISSTPLSSAMLDWFNRMGTGNESRSQSHDTVRVSHCHHFRNILERKRIGNPALSDFLSFSFDRDG